MSKECIHFFGPLCISLFRNSILVVGHKAGQIIQIKFYRFIQQVVCAVRMLAVLLSIRTEVSLHFPPSLTDSSGILSSRFSQLLSQLTGRYLTSETECYCKVPNINLSASVNANSLRLSVTLFRIKHSESYTEDCQLEFRVRMC